MKHFVFLCFIFSFNSSLLISQTSWEHTDGPQGSVLSSLYSGEKFAFIAEKDFLFRTTDGLQWEKLPHAGPHLLASYKDTLLHPLYNTSQQKMRLQVSTDNGDSWVIIDLPDLITGYGNLVMCSHGIYWSQVSNNLLLKSIDLGATWDTIYHPISYNLDVFDEILYGYNSARIWRTGDGYNWEEIMTPNDPAEREYIDDLVVKDSNIMFTTEKLLFYTNDDGKTWLQRSAYSRNSYDKITLVGNDVYFQYDDYLFRTSDFGNTWDTLSLDPQISLITFTGGTGVFLASSYNKGVFRWDDSADAMLESNDGLTKGLIYDLDYGGDKIWASCGNGVFAYDISSATWSDKMDLPLPSFEYGTVSANDNGRVVTAIDYSDTLFISDDNGMTWNKIGTEYYIEELQLLGNNIFLFHDYGLFRSIDKGLHWDTLHVFTGDNHFVEFQGENYLLNYNGLSWTTDNGLSWSFLADTLDHFKLYSDGSYLYRLTVDSTGYIDLYISSNAVDWENAGEGLPDIHFSDFQNEGRAFFFRDEDHFYAFLGYYGHYISPVDNISWTPFESSQYGNEYLIHDGIIYLGDEGMYTSEILNPYITNTKEVGAKHSISIYPVPATDVLNISMPENEFTGMVRYMLYDVRGTLIKSMYSESSLSLRMDIRDIPPGIFFLHVITGNNHGTIKVIKN